MRGLLPGRERGGNNLIALGRLLEGELGDASGVRKRMRQFGRVEIPQSAFIAALKLSDD